MKDQSKQVRAVWIDEVPKAEWEVYRDVLRGANAAGIPFALAGAFALASYTRHWRNTKDLDLCVPPEDRERMIEVVKAAGLKDYYEEKPYDRLGSSEAFATESL